MPPSTQHTSEPAEQQYSGLRELLLVERCMPRYNDFIASLIWRELKDTEPAKPVVDFGAGIGTLATLYRQKSGIDPLCVEIDSENQRHLQQRGLKTCAHIGDTGEIAAVFSSNVLEHIEDDRAALNAIAAQMPTGGKLVLYLPAFRVLFSGLDRAVGHHRRYGKRDLMDKLAGAGFAVRKCHYVDTLGFFSALAVRLLGYNSEKGLGSPLSLKIYDRLVLPLSRLLDALGGKFLLGKNILAVAQKL